MPKTEIRSDAGTEYSANLICQSTNERFARLLAEGFVKMNQEQCMRFKRFNGAQLLRQRINQGRHPGRSHDAVGMPIKRNHQRNACVLPRIGYRLPDNLLVAQMDSIKKPNGQADLAPARLQILCCVDNLHQARSVCDSLSGKERMSGWSETSISVSASRNSSRFPNIHIPMI